MATNPFKMICSDCGSPWKDGSKVCWNCGSQGFTDNPDYGRPIARPDQGQSQSLSSPPQLRSTYEPRVSEAPYIVATLLIAAAVFIGVLLTLDDSEVENAWAYAVFLALIAGGNAWLASLIILTKAKVDRVGRVVDVIERRLNG